MHEVLAILSGLIIHIPIVIEIVLFVMQKFCCLVFFLRWNLLWAPLNWCWNYAVEVSYGLEPVMTRSRNSRFCTLSRVFGILVDHSCHPEGKSLSWRADLFKRSGLRFEVHFNVILLATFVILHSNLWNSPSVFGLDIFRIFIICLFLCFHFWLFAIYYSSNYNCYLINNFKIK